MNTEQIDIVKRAIESLIGQRSSYDAERGTDNQLIDEAQAILENQ